MTAEPLVLGLLASGGSADVFAAALPTPAGVQLAALKRLRPTGADDRMRFERELSRLGRLRHPNIVAVLGGDGTRGELFTELLYGVTAERWAHESTSDAAERLPLALYVVTELLAGLHYAHEACDAQHRWLALVHRDCSPNNVFLTTAGAVKLLDFGIAKAAEDSTQTATGTVRGSVRSMAPEQAMTLPLDRRVDVFAAGLLLFHAVTGRSLWHGMKDTEIFRALVTGDYMRMLSPVPALLGPALASALAPRPSERPASAEALRFELLAIADQLPLPMPPRQLLRQQLHHAYAAEIARTRSTLEERRARGLADPRPLA